MAVHGAPEDRTEVILLIYARYPINGLNGEMSSKNIRKLCHSIYAAIRNSYKTPSAFYIDKKVIKSQEGTTQGDPLAMLLYGVATLPLIDKLEDHDFPHKWYADEVMWPVVLSCYELFQISSMNMAVHLFTWRSMALLKILLR